MRHGSLFSGIGGFDLASEWMGWENVFHCEWNEFGQKVLKYYWPKAITYNDITKTDFSIHRGSIDIITGGFPCQPYSMAGKRLGKEDERHLWPEMRRAIREIRPTWVVGENVFGLVNWNGGMVFEEVQTDLEAEGYEVQSFVLPAASVNAPHKRERIWIVAHAKPCSDSGNSREVSTEAKEENGGRIESGISPKQQIQLPTESSTLFKYASDSNLYGCQQKWRYDWGSKNVDGCKQKEFGSTNSENFNRFHSNGNFKGESITSKKIVSKGIYEKDKVAESNRICEMDKDFGKSERIIEKNEFTFNESRALVSEGQNRIQLSIDTRLEDNKDSLSSSKTNGFSNDSFGVNRMERNSSDSNNSRLKAFSIQKSELAKENRSTPPSGNGSRFIRGGLRWEAFPISAPICDGNDGISDRLDSITFSKWRNESIKAGGNAIVPQVVYQIFKAIEQYNNLNK